MKKSNFVYVSTLCLAMVGCGGSDANLEIEKEKLKLEREKLEMEKNKNTSSEPSQQESGQENNAKDESDSESEKQRRKEVADKASKANQFQPYTEAVVVVSKTYFYSSPEDGAKKKSFLIEGDRIMVEKSQRNFVKVTFTNEANGKVTSGWIKSDDLEPIYAD
jgi:hypothetical protein